MKMQRSLLRRCGGPRAAATVTAAALLVSLQGCGGSAPSGASAQGAAGSPPPAVAPAVASRAAASGSTSGASPSARPPDTADAAAVRPVRAPPAGTRLPSAGDPIAVRLPRLGISAVIDPLHLSASRELLPPRYGRAGWYERGPEPGELGRAVIAGHVDSQQGGDVFWNLRGARAGDRIVVDVARGRSVRFVVQSVGQFPRVEFPSERVYGGRQRQAELRLITCGGAYDRSRGGYQDNVVVFAVRG